MALSLSMPSKFATRHEKGATKAQCKPNNRKSQSSLSRNHTLDCSGYGSEFDLKAANQHCFIEDPSMSVPSKIAERKVTEL